MSQDSSKALKFFHDHSPPSAITFIEIWGKYAAPLYTVPGQSPLPDPPNPGPQTCTFFTAETIKKAIDRMRTRRAYDHDGLVAKHFINARDMLLEVMLNQAMCEGFLKN